MTENDRMVGQHLLETGVVVPFRLLKHEILAAPDPAEFGIRLELKFEPDDEHGDPEDIVEWGAFGFMFVLALLSFADARPRESSALDYCETDELTVSDFLACLSFRRGAPSSGRTTSGAAG